MIKLHRITASEQISSSLSCRPQLRVLALLTSSCCLAIPALSTRLPLSSPANGSRSARAGGSALLPHQASPGLGVVGHRYGGCGTKAIGRTLAGMGNY